MEARGLQSKRRGKATVVSLEPGPPCIRGAWANSALTLRISDSFSPHTNNHQPAFRCQASVLLVSSHLLILSSSFSPSLSLRIWVLLAPYDFPCRLHSPSTSTPRGLVDGIFPHHLTGCRRVRFSHTRITYYLCLFATRFLCAFSQRPWLTLEMLGLICPLTRPLLAHLATMEDTRAHSSSTCLRRSPPS
jgi:hypothetical protein